MPPRGVLHSSIPILIDACTLAAPHALLAQAENAAAITIAASRAVSQARCSP
jgi:hypothetical protein